MQTGEIAETLGKGIANISKMLKKMVEDGVLVSVSYGEYGIPNQAEKKNKSEENTPSQSQSIQAEIFPNDG